MSVHFRGQSWELVLQLSVDPTVNDWIEVADSGPARPDEHRRLAVRVSLVHPFMQSFAGADPEQIEPLIRVAAAIALAETVARDSGVRLAGTVRRNINELLRHALAKV